MDSIGNLAEVTDEALARAARQNSAAFAALYRRYVARVYRYALARLGSVDDAEDLTAETFEAALRVIGSFRGDGPFAAWLMAIARNQVITRYRTRRDARPLEGVESLAGDSLPLEEVAGQRLILASVLEALAQMSGDHAEVIRLRLFAELTTAETARVMGRSEAAVKMLLHRALRELRAREGIEVGDEVRDE